MQRLKRLVSKPQQPKPLPFTDEQIRERAYRLWQAHPEQSEVEHWQGAIEALQRERSLFGRMGEGWQTATHKDNRVFALDVVKVVISGFGVLATIFAGVGLYLTYQNSQAERQLNSERLVTDRFAKAVEQLGSKEIDVRIGAIYSLERIASDSPKDHWTIMEVLTAFVRNRSQFPPGFPLPAEAKKELPIVTTDVQAALTVIGRRDVEHDPWLQWLDIRSTNLNNASLAYADFSHANLSITNLKGAQVRDTNLSRADLQGARLQGGPACAFEQKVTVLNSSITESLDL